MAKKPPTRPPRVDALGDLHIGGDNPQQATERHLDALKDAIGRAAQAAVTPTVNRLTLNPLRPVPTTPGSIYIDPSDGELYYIDPDGDATQLSNQSSGGGGGGGGDTYGNREYVIPLIDVTVALGSVGAPGDGFVNISTTANNTQLVFGPLPIRVGERAKSCTARVNKNSLGTMTLRFQRSIDGAPRADIGTSATSSTNGLQTLTSTVAAPTELVANDNYYVTISCPNSGDNVHWVTYTVDKVV